MYSMISKILNFALVEMSKSLYVISKDSTPKDSKYVVTCTRESCNEVIMLGAALYPNQIRYMARKKLFKNKWIGKFSAPLNAFPVDHKNPGPSTLKHLVNLLKGNKTVGTFPTGSRTSQEGAPLKHDASATVVPSESPTLLVAYVGLTKIHGLITGQTYVSVGKPIDINNSPGDLKQSERIDCITRETETRTAKLQQELHEAVKSL